MDGYEPRENKKKLPEYKQPEHPWMQNNNYFTAISKEEETDDDLKFKKESDNILKEFQQQTQSIQREKEIIQSST